MPELGAPIEAREHTRGHSAPEPKPARTFWPWRRAFVRDKHRARTQSQAPSHLTCPRRPRDKCGTDGAVTRRSIRTGRLTWALTCSPNGVRTRVSTLRGMFPASHDERRDRRLAVRRGLPVAPGRIAGPRGAGAFRSVPAPHRLRESDDRTARRRRTEAGDGRDAGGSDPPERARRRSTDRRDCPVPGDGVGPDMGGNREDGSGDGLGSAELPSLAHPLLRSRLVPSALESPTSLGSPKASRCISL